MLTVCLCYKSGPLWFDVGMIIGAGMPKHYNKFMPTHLLIFTYYVVLAIRKLEFPMRILATPIEVWRAYPMCRGGKFVPTM